ncbi:MAG: fumarylacetoacetate hydrolase family protein [Anaerolineae bacterium]|jgi:2-keto-4-pentenoate hydratase/2-oxohepta-3-ene-1,7-dioic acid hydratase in catechol pathway|nr:fumarylacetoacetate hydrolase family protein [Anaerolineae bacterium]
MKLLRYLSPQNDTVELGMMTSQGVIPLTGWLEDSPACLLDLLTTPQSEKTLQTPIPMNAPGIPLDQITILPPIQHPGKILCVGLNYRDHVLEGGRKIPEFPTIFQKANSSIIGHQHPIQLPAASSKVDLEAELAVVIGKKARNVTAKHAYEHVGGYTILNDVSERDYQNRTSQWTMGKSCDTFCPIGPVLVTKEDIPDPQSLEIKSTLNGITMQKSNTKHLIFTIPFLIEYISAVMTLEPGDIIATGTPGGVGVFRKPPIFLKPDDIVEITIEGIGTLSNPVVGVV